jgi:hypothetical protein
MGPMDTWLNNVAPLGNQAVNGENKHQPVYREKPVYSTQNQIASSIASFEEKA